MDELTKKYIDDQLRMQMHDGNYAQRINLFDIFGYIQTVTAEPSAAPANIYSQFQIYNGIFYYYDFLNNVWLHDAPIATVNTLPSGAPANGNLSNQFKIFNGILYYYDFTNSVWRNSSGALFDHFATVGNSTTSETDLYSDTTAANTFRTNGDKLEVEYGGSFVSSGTATRQLKIYFGGNAIFDSGALTLSLSAAWTIYLSIIRVSGTVVRYMISMTTEGAALAAYTAVGEVTGLTLTNANILKITGTAAGVGAATNDILAKMGDVRFIPAA